MGEPDMRPHLVVTGFGEFAGVKSNPSTWLVQQLQTLHAQDEGYTFKVMEVSAACVDRELVELSAQLLRGGQQQAIWLHFGVHGLASGFKLEAQAFNDADFRVPDQAGWKPQRQPIDAAFPITHVLRTDLHLHRLAGTLEHKVEVSHDAGRFVCNYTLYRSLQKCQQQQQQQQQQHMVTQRGGSDCGLWHALFVHVPPFEAVPRHEQLAFASDLLRLVCTAVPSTADAIGGPPSASGVTQATFNNSDTTEHWPLLETAAATCDKSDHSKDGGSAVSIVGGSGGGAVQQVLRRLQVDKLSASIVLLGCYLMWTWPGSKQA